MNKLIFFTFILFGSIAFGQAPNWTKPEFRQSNYPQSQFLTGFIEVTEVNKKYVDEELQQLVDAAKSNLVQSVRVQVKSVSTSDVSDYNGEIEDYFNQKTTSNSELQLIGLQTESYYDKKSKKGFAFAFVNKSKMIEYYRSEIGKNTIDIGHISDRSTSLLKEGNLQLAFKKGLEAYNKFFVIDESQKILMAIGANSSLDTRADEVSELNKKFDGLMVEILTDRRMTLDDMGFIIANGLSKSQGDLHKGIKLEEFTYAQTGFTSDFSYKLKGAISESLPSETTSIGYIISGVYLWEEDNLVVKSKMISTKTKSVVGRNTVQINELQLVSNKITVIPQDIKNLKSLEIMTVTSQTVGAKGKAGLGLDKDLMAIVEVNGSPQVGVPVNFYNNNGGVVYCKTISDAEGKVSCKVKKIGGAYRNQIIKASVDLSRFLSNDSSTFLIEFLKNKDVPASTFKVVVEPSTINVVSEENNFGNSLDVKLIEPKLKQSLSGQGFDFTAISDGADYVIHIRASSRKGGQVGGVYFAFVDVSISVYDNNIGREIFKESINNIKGGGGTFDQAGGKAFYEASDLAKEKIETLLVD
ncbi:MAG: hypothetical protein ACI9GM_000037 [Salibacteraceae bacterium]|jgi:hypothetical protein